MKALKIRKFLSTLLPADARYLEIQLAMARDARKMIEEFKLSKEGFCKLLQISPESYESYLNGSFNYNLEKMALFQSVWVQLRIEEAQLEAKTVGTYIDIPDKT